MIEMKKMLFFVVLIAAVVAVLGVSAVVAQSGPTLEEISTKAKAEKMDGGVTDETRRVLDSLLAANADTVNVGVPVADEPKPDTWAWLRKNWIALVGGLLALWEVIARLTPTERDNTVLAWVQRLLSVFVPNRKSGGGRF